MANKQPIETNAAQQDAARCNGNEKTVWHLSHHKCSNSQIDIDLLVYVHLLGHIFFKLLEPLATNSSVIVTISLVMSSMDFSKSEW